MEPAMEDEEQTEEEERESLLPETVLDETPTATRPSLHFHHGLAVRSVMFAACIILFIVSVLYDGSGNEFMISEDAVSVAAMKHSFVDAVENATAHMQLYVPAPGTKWGTDFQDETACDFLRHQMDDRLPTVLVRHNLNGCYGMTQHMAGTGNQVSSYVGYRMAFLAEGNTAFLYDCGDDADKVDIQASVVFPWLSGFFPAASSFETIPFDMPMPYDYCPLDEKEDDIESEGKDDGDERRRRLYNRMPIKYMTPMISYDLRRMAIALVGVHPDPGHLSHQFSTQYLVPEAQQPPFTPVAATGGTIYKVPIHQYFENGPLHPNVELDDVTIHFRCGDVLLGAFGPFYYPKFEAYTNLISPQAKTVGILTQAFGEDGSTNAPTRSRDKIDESGGRCRVLVEGLRDYILDKSPNIEKVHIHNGPGETVALAYARMIMANQTLNIFPSTFSGMPALTTFGTGYVTKPFDKLSFANTWLKHELSKDLYPNRPVEVKLQGHMIYCQDLKTMWQFGDDFVLDWFLDPSKSPTDITP